MPATTESKTRKIRVLLAEDHPLMREGIRSSIAAHSGLALAGEATNGLEAIELADTTRPDVILMDLNLPRLNGIEATRAIIARNPAIRIIALSVHNSREYVQQFLRAGARGYLTKDSAPAEMLQAINRVMVGERYFSEDVARFMVDDYVTGARSRGRPFGEGGITDREREVLILVAQSMSSRQIAEKLGVSLRTVTTHRERLMRKLDVHTTAALVRYASENGFV